MNCGCGSEVRHAFYELGCLECGAPCCPTCAIHLESATYCARCAETLLGVPTVQHGDTFDLQ